jgi:hypothetical protein
MTEVTAFVHIISQLLFESFLDQGILKNKGHEKCCLRCFPTPELQQTYEQQLSQAKEKAGINAENICTCSVFDLLMQVNFLVTNRSRRALYDFTFKMFKSYDF